MHLRITRFLNITTYLQGGERNPKILRNLDHVIDGRPIVYFKIVIKHNNTKCINRAFNLYIGYAY